MQIIIVVVEFLGNAVIKNDRVVLETKAKEGKEGPAGASAAAKKAAKSNIQPVIFTTITPQEHERLTQLIYTDYDLLDLIYKQIVMRIPEPAAVGQLSSTGKAGSQPRGGKYLPSAEEIKLGARAFASMPFQILKKKNPILMVNAEFEDAKLFSITGFFTALLKIIENGYGAVPA